MTTQPPLDLFALRDVRDDADCDPILDRLVADLAARTTVLDEIRTALRGADERERLTLALLGAMAFARRAGCRPALIRGFVACVVREALAGAEWDESTRRRAARASVGLVDAVYLLCGTEGFDQEPQLVVGELRRVLGASGA